MNMLSMQRRLERYRIIYIWKILENQAPNCGIKKLERLFLLALKDTLAPNNLCDYLYITSYLPYGHLSQQKLIKHFLGIPFTDTA